MSPLMTGPTLPDALRGAPGQDGIETPLLTIDLQQIRRNHHALTSAFADLGALMYYAVKANPAPDILATLTAVGCRFDIASLDPSSAPAPVTPPPSRRRPTTRRAPIRTCATPITSPCTGDMPTDLLTLATSRYPSVRAAG
ncbi:hypothetical protein [Nonomuraea sp. NPDC049695]|uniref:hypothetical protein n=1 Tax=Nonomuraea sp. NPDC049695 TaxID=3154734 RepID=UPI00342CDD5B